MQTFGLISKNNEKRRCLLEQNERYLTRLIVFRAFPNLGSTSNTFPI